MNLTNTYYESLMDTPENVSSTLNILKEHCTDIKIHSCNPAADQLKGLVYIMLVELKLKGTWSVKEYLDWKSEMKNKRVSPLTINK